MSMYRQFNPKFVLQDLTNNLARISQEHNREVLQKGYSNDSIQTRVIQFVRLTFVLRGINKLFIARNETKAYKQAIKLQVVELHKEVEWTKKEMNKLDYDALHPMTTNTDTTQYYLARERYLVAKMELKVKQDVLANLNFILIKQEAKKKKLFLVHKPAAVKNMQEFLDFYKNAVKDH